MQKILRRPARNVQSQNAAKNNDSIYFKQKTHQKNEITQDQSNMKIHAKVFLFGGNISISQKHQRRNPSTDERLNKIVEDVVTQTRSP